MEIFFSRLPFPASFFYHLLRTESTSPLTQQLLLEVLLPYDPRCPSVGWSVIIFPKGLDGVALVLF